MRKLLFERHGITAPSPKPQISSPLQIADPSQHPQAQWTGKGGQDSERPCVHKWRACEWANQNSQPTFCRFLTKQQLLCERLRPQVKLKQPGSGTCSGQLLLLCAGHPLLLGVTEGQSSPSGWREGVGLAQPLPSAPNGHSPLPLCDGLAILQSHHCPVALSRRTRLTALSCSSVR